MGQSIRMNRVIIFLAVELLETENFSMCIRLSKAVKRRYDGLAPKEFELYNLRGHIDKPMVVDNSKFDG